MAHLKPLNPADIQDSELQGMLKRYLDIRKFIPNSVLTMSRRPAIAKAFAQLNQAILYEGTVPEEMKMLVALISSQASGCRYCQSHMANLSSIFQASDEKIAHLWEFETHALFSDGERAALRRQQLRVRRLAGLYRRAGGSRGGSACAGAGRGDCRV